MADMHADTHRAANDTRSEAIEALAEALHTTDIANVAFVGEEDDHPTDAAALLDYLDAHPEAKAALLEWLVGTPIELLAAALHRLNIPIWDYGRMRDPHDPNDQTGCMSFHQEQAEAIYREWTDPSTQPIADETTEEET